MANAPKETKPQEQQAKPSERGRVAETGMAPYRQSAPVHYGSAWEPITRLRDEFDRLFDQFSRGWLAPWEPGRRDGWGLDVRDDDVAVTVRAEAPGFEPGDFDIQVRGGQLVLRATHKAETKEEDEGFREWRRQEFYRSIPLPAEIDSDKVTANYRNGVLTVALPKTETSKAKKITVSGE